MGTGTGDASRSRPIALGTQQPLVTASPPATAPCPAAKTTTRLQPSHLAQHGEVGGQGEGEQVALQRQAHALGSRVHEEHARVQALVGAAWMYVCRWVGGKVGHRRLVTVGGQVFRQACTVRLRRCTHLVCPQPGPA